MLSIGLTGVAFAVVALLSFRRLRYRTAESLSSDDQTLQWDDKLVRKVLMVRQLSRDGVSAQLPEEEEELVVGSINVVGGTPASATGSTSGSSSGGGSGGSSGDSGRSSSSGGGSGGGGTSSSGGAVGDAAMVAGRGGGGGGGGGAGVTATTTTTTAITDDGAGKSGRSASAGSNSGSNSGSRSGDLEGGPSLARQPSAAELRYLRLERWRRAVFKVSRGTVQRGSFVVARVTIVAVELLLSQLWLLWW